MASSMMPLLVCFSCDALPMVAARGRTSLTPRRRTCRSPHSSTMPHGAINLASPVRHCVCAKSVVDGPIEGACKKQRPITIRCLRESLAFQSTLAGALRLMTTTMLNLSRFCPPSPSPLQHQPLFCVSPSLYFVLERQTTVEDIFKKYPEIEQECNDEVANHEWCTNLK